MYSILLCYTFEKIPKNILGLNMYIRTPAVDNTAAFPFF